MLQYMFDIGLKEGTEKEEAAEELNKEGEYWNEEYGVEE